MAEYDAEDRELLRLNAAMKDLIGTKMWETYTKIIESQIATREAIILDNPASLASDPMVRLLEIEQIKGARLGLKLALSTPQQIIDDTKAMIAAQGGQVEDET